VSGFLRAFRQLTAAADYLVCVHYDPR